MEDNYYSRPPHVEVEQYYPPPQNYHHHSSQQPYYNYNRQAYRPSSGGRYHDHSESRGNVVTVNPQPTHGVQEQGNVHDHNSSNVHGHS